MPLVEQMQIMHDVLDIDTIFDVDTVHIYTCKSNIHAYHLRYTGVFYMKLGIVLKIVNFNSLIY